MKILGEGTGHKQKFAIQFAFPTRQKMTMVAKWAFLEILWEFLESLLIRMHRK